MASAGEIFSLVKSGLGAFANLLEALEKEKAGQAYGPSLARYASDVADICTKLVNLGSASSSRQEPTSLPGIINLTGVFHDDNFSYTFLHFSQSGNMIVDVSRAGGSGKTEYTGGAIADAGSAAYLVSGTNERNQFLILRGSGNRSRISQTIYSPATHEVWAATLHRP